MNFSLSGFTRGELLIVVTILGVLGLVANYQFNLATARARDFERKEQVKRVVQALRDYYIDNGVYPPHSDTYGLTGCGALEATCPVENGEGVRCEWQEEAIETHLQCGDIEYLRPVPRSPKHPQFVGRASHRYKRIGLEEMVVEACLELSSDIEAMSVKESLTEMGEVCNSRVMYQIKS